MLSKDEVCQLVESGRHLTGCVHITGGWNGAITVDCSAKLAKQASANLFDLKPEEASQEDVYDTLSELTNMTGGNLKALLAQGFEEPCQLSIPSVTEGADYSLSLPGAREVFKAGFTIAGEPMVVTLLKAESGGGRRES